LDLTATTTPRRAAMRPTMPLVVLGLLAVAAVLPLVLNAYWLRIFTSMLMYGVLAQALNVIVGFAGYHAFGNVVWFGTGAYACALALVAGLPLPLALLLGMAVSALLAFVIGGPLLRLSGHYFAIATVALSLAAHETALGFSSLTGGASGVNLPIGDMSPEAFYTFVCYLMLGALVLATATVAWLARSRLGFGLRALKDSEHGAKVMGVNTTLAKVTAWAISAALSGLAGGIWSMWMSFIEPGTAFDIRITVTAYIMMLMGGMGSLFGPVLGAFFLEFVSTVIWAQFLKIHMLVLGVLIVLVVVFLPEGMMAPLRRRLKRGGRP
jgi:branched-chain amino acid transport system permease protein